MVQLLQQNGNCHHSYYNSNFLIFDCEGDNSFLQKPEYCHQCEKSVVEKAGYIIG